MTLAIMASVIMLSVTNKPIVLNVFMMCRHAECCVALHTIKFCMIVFLSTR
jgi:hypothetical protein